MATADKLRSLCAILKRKKVYSAVDFDAGNLKRCMTWWDLTAMGVGSTLGVGMYVVTGHVARELAGPSLVLSFLIAGLASVFSGLCYAEFGARVPKAGSAYIYSYVCVGEFVAFIIGWNLIFEYLIGSASVVRGLSLYVDSMVNGTMQRSFRDVAPIDLPSMSSYFDFFAFSAILLLGLGLAFGLRVSMSINNVLAAVNIAVVLFVIIAGSFNANTANWSIAEADLPADVNAGTGGFFPFGVIGTLRGAAVCFYGYVGFDSISTTGEEVKDPRKAIPFSIILSLVLVAMGYLSVSTVITMMVPYYLQSSESPLPFVFSHVGWEWARWIVAIGAIFGLCASLFGAMFPLPRILYSMARDGLLFRFLGQVEAERKSPIIATLLAATIIGILAALFELRSLVSLMSLGTLLAYTIVAACVLILRYQTEVEVAASGLMVSTQHAQYAVSERSGARAVLLQLVGMGHRKPTQLTADIVLACVILLGCACAAVGLVHQNAPDPLVPICALLVLILLIVLIIALQPSCKISLTYQVPFVPLVPCLSMFVNIYLMTMLPGPTWIKFLIWIAIGVPIYVICLCMYGRPPATQSNGHLRSNLNHTFDANTGKKNKSDVFIVVQPPTPLARRGNDEQSTPTLQRNQPTNVAENQNKIVHNTEVCGEDSSPARVMNVMHHDDDYDTMLPDIEHDDADKFDRETRIIELLDQVLEAEEESYPENAAASQLNESSAVSSGPATPEPCARAPVMENSDAESVASTGGLASPTYDVIALVHREDLPKVNEEASNEQVDDEQIEQIYKEILNDTEQNENIGEVTHGEATVLEPSKYLPNGLIHIEQIDSDLKRDNAYDETEVTVADELSLSEDRDTDETVPDVEAKPVIPIPPPMDENLFTGPSFKRAHTIVVIPRKSKEETAERQTHERTFSGGSVDDSVMVFGSDKQAHFMNKLSDILQKQKVPPAPGGAKRSVSSGHISDMDKTEREESETPPGWPPPAIMADLKSELLARHSKVNAELRPRDVKSDEPDALADPGDNGGSNGSRESDEETLDISMSRIDLKSKLENIFAAGGGMMLKPRLVASTPPTPEPSPQGSTSDELLSSPELSALKDKTEKNDTLKLQRAKFGAVLNSFRISMAKDADSV